jgi:hypothetical protein
MTDAVNLYNYTIHKQIPISTTTNLVNIKNKTVTSQLNYTTNYTYLNMTRAAQVKTTSLKLLQKLSRTNPRKKRIDSLLGLQRSRTVN